MPRTQASGQERASRRSGGGGAGGARSDGSGERTTKAGSDSTTTGPVKSSHIIEEHIDVGVPRDVAFDQWTRYEDLSRFTKSESADAKRSDRVHFSSKIGPSTRQWETQVVEQEPGHRIVWRSIGGAQTMGVVSFHDLDERLTRVMVEMEYHPRGFVETAGNFLRFQRRRVRKDLRLFKNFIELRGEATGKGARDHVDGGSGLRQETDERLDDSQEGPGQARQERQRRAPAKAPAAKKASAAKPRTRSAARPKATKSSPRSKRAGAAKSVARKTSSRSSSRSTQKKRAS